MSKYDILVVCRKRDCEATRRIVCQTVGDRKRAMRMRWYCWKHR